MQLFHELSELFLQIDRLDTLSPNNEVPTLTARAYSLSQQIYHGILSFRDPTPRPSYSNQGFRGPGYLLDLQRATGELSIGTYGSLADVVRKRIILDEVVDEPGRELSCLMASKEKTLRHTHSRYFTYDDQIQQNIRQILGIHPDAIH